MNSGPSFYPLPSRFVTYLAAAIIAAQSTGFVRASGTVTNADSAAVRQAIEGGGTVTLAFDGVVALTEPLVITTNTSVDATGYIVSLDGAGNVRHFTTTNGAVLH